MTLQFDDEAALAMERMYQTPDVVGQRARFHQALALRHGESVLDVGVGPGLLAREMADCVGETGCVAHRRCFQSLAQALSDGGQTGEVLAQFVGAGAVGLPAVDNQFRQTGVDQMGRGVPAGEGGPRQGDHRNPHQ